MAKSSCKIRIEAMQTVIPANPTCPRISTKLAVNPKDSPVSTTAAAFHVVLIFKKAWERDSGWVQAGWIKESLGDALNGNPIFAGRLRRCDGGMEIVANDSGVRLVEARTDVAVAEFLKTAAEKGRGDAAETAAEFVFWEDLPEENTNFSPLLYVQVTNFSCGGYSVGISCSLMLTDPFTLIAFLETWINKIHRQISTSRRDKSDFYPMFYHPHLRKSSTTNAAAAAAAAHSLLLTPPAADTVVFRVARFEEEGKDCEDLVEKCVERAEEELGRRAKRTEKFHVVIRGASPDSDGEIRVVGRSEKRVVRGEGGGLGSVVGSGWVGLDQIWLNEGRRSECSYCWISNSARDLGFVSIVPSCDATKIIVTFPFP